MIIMTGLDLEKGKSKEDIRSEDHHRAKWCLFFSNVGIAFSDVIVDSLMII